MTVVVAVEHAGGVVLGCDSFLGSTSTNVTVDRPKWWANGSVIVAYAGSLRGAQVAEHWLAPFRRAKRGETDESYLVTCVSASIRAAHEEVGGDPEKLVSENGSVYLVAYRGRAYLLQGDYSVAHAAHGYLAIGAGEDVALGAMAATDGQPARDRVQRALEASARHCPMVRAPFRVTEQKRPPERKAA